MSTSHPHASMKKRPAHPRHALCQEFPVDHMATCSDIRGHQQNLISSAGLSPGQKEKHIFLQRQRQWIVADWNSVPDAVITASSVNCFRSCLAAQWMKQKYLQGFCPGKNKKRNRESTNLPYSQRELWLSGTASLIRLSRAASTVNCL